VLQKRLNASAAANIKVEAKRKLRRLWLLGPFGKAAQGFEPSHARDRLHSDASRDETTARLLLRKGILFHDIVQPRLDEERVQIIAILCTLQADYNGTIVQWHKDTLTVLANAEVQATGIHVTLQSLNVRICEEHAQIFMLPTHLPSTKINSDPLMHFNNCGIPDNAMDDGPVIIAPGLTDANQHPPKLCKYPGVKSAC